MENKRLLLEEELNSEHAAKVTEPDLYKILDDIKRDNVPLHIFPSTNYFPLAHYSI